MGTVPVRLRRSQRSLWRESSQLALRYYPDLTLKRSSLVHEHWALARYRGKTGPGELAPSYGLAPDPDEGQGYSRNTVRRLHAALLVEAFDRVHTIWKSKADYSESFSEFI